VITERGLRPGQRILQTDASELIIISRSIPQATGGKIPAQTFIESLNPETGQAWASVLFRAHELRRQGFHRHLDGITPLTISRRLKSGLEERRTDPNMPIERLMTLFLLQAADGMLTQGNKRDNTAIDTVIGLLPRYEEQVVQDSQVHTPARGVLNAHLARMACNVDLNAQVAS
jgi:hypothetical protein